MTTATEQPTGRPDPGTVRVSYGPPETDLATQRTRYRRFCTWRENGRQCGSWAWTDDPPPAPSDG